MLKVITGNRTYTTIVAVWLTLSVASVFLAAVTWWQLSLRLNEARQAVAIQDEVDAILKLLLDGETSQRGFTITGNEAFLQPLLESEPQLSMRFDSLTDLVRHDETLLDRVMQLRGQAEVLVRHHHHIVKIRHEEGEPAAAKIINDGEGRKVMDSIRDIVNDIKFHKGTLISSDGGDAQRSQLLRAGMTSLVAGIIGVGAGVIAYWQALLAIRHQRRERELVEARLEAERSSHEKTVFLTNMSHEIRTPMNAILGFCELLEGDVEDPRHQEYIKAISTSGHSLLQLINDILDMSKIEAGVLVLQEEPTDLRQLCQFLKTMFTEPASRKGVELHCEVAEDLPRALLLDRIRLRQILVNLVGNAVKFTDQGSITVRAGWRKSQDSSQIDLWVEVQDTGAGIPQDRLDDIFEPFVQAGAHRAKERQGTGLGLSIVKRLVHMMGAQITARSALGQGSTFALHFKGVPISSRLAASDRSEETASIDFDQLQSAHWLVVDDHPANCDLVAGMVAGTTHRLDFARDGQQAVDMAKALRPDIILMDIRMPNMDGRDALEAIRQVPGLEMTPIIAVTASTLMSEEDSWKDRFNGYLRKPFSKRQLFNELAQFLPRRDTDRETTIQSVEEPSETLSDAPVSPLLIEELRRLSSEDWIQLKECPAFNECLAFSEKLTALAERYEVPSLGSYAAQLAREARQYAVLELESRLASFPDLVAQLEKQVASI